MTNRYPGRGPLKEKDPKLDDGSIFKLFSPIYESIPNSDSTTQDKQLGQKALHLPPLRMKTIRNVKTAASLRGITSESLKQILKESINFSERLSDVQQMHHHVGGQGESMREVAHSLMHENPLHQQQSFVLPSTSQPRISPIDVKTFHLSLAPTAIMGRVGKPSRLAVSNQNRSQNGLQPVAPKPNTPTGSSPHGTIRAASRGKKIAVKYFGLDKSELAGAFPDSGRSEELVVDSARPQAQLTCLEFKPSHHPHGQVPEIRKCAHHDAESLYSHFSSFENLRPNTSNDHNIISSQVPRRLSQGHLMSHGTVEDDLERETQMLLDGIQEAVGREESAGCDEPSESLSERMSKQLEELESRFQILHSSILEEEEILANTSSGGRNAESGGTMELLQEENKMPEETVGHSDEPSVSDDAPFVDNFKVLLPPHLYDTFEKKYVAKLAGQSIEIELISIQQQSWFSNIKQSEDDKKFMWKFVQRWHGEISPVCSIPWLCLLPPVQHNYTSFCKLEPMVPPPKSSALMPVSLTGTIVYDVLTTPIDDEAQNLALFEQFGSDSSLRFESRFESGNLSKAIRVGDNNYELLVMQDSNTTSKTQWYYFRVKGARRGCRYSLRILNFEKADSQYKKGLRPLMYSTKLESWNRSCDNVQYQPNNLGKMQSNTHGTAQRPYFTLEFTFQASCVDDELYFAHCYPYTLTDHWKHMASIQSSPAGMMYMSRSLLCYSEGGNPCEVVTINETLPVDQVDERPVIVLTSRIHPGESNASWLMRGVLEGLLSDAPRSAELRKEFIFKIVPVLNPDGVVHGMYRCSLLGQDLNRMWLEADSAMHPTIYSVQKMVSRLQKEKHRTLLYIDLHGHSVKQGVFMYGVNDMSAGPFLESDIVDPTRVAPHKSMPTILSRILSTFRLDNCMYRVNKQKEGTGRVVMHRRLKVPYSYTLEASFAGFDSSRQGSFHFDHKSFTNAGRSIVSYFADQMDQCACNGPSFTNHWCSGREHRPVEELRGRPSAIRKLCRARTTTRES